MTIKAPYNFIPLNGNVYFPEWNQKISHDAPFQDGISGVIQLEITAQTPVFVRNGHSQEQAESNSQEYRSFSNMNRKYFIPGTSIKGAIRSVMEIMSFGKMRLDKNAMFAQRTWDDLNLYPLKKEQGKLLCGWLQRVKSSKNSEKKEYKIINCGHPYRIGHRRIDEYLSKGVTNRRLFEQYFRRNSEINFNNKIQLNGKEYDPKAAALALAQEQPLSNLTFEFDDELCNEYKDNRLKVAEGNTGCIKGTIVFTGQPDTWKYPRPRTLTNDAGKFYDFVFRDPNEIELNKKDYFLSEEYFNHFKFIYSDSIDWKTTLQQLDREGVPVFFKVQNGEIKDFGLAYLYKLPYNNSPYDLLDKNHKSEEPDLCECIFGYSNKNKSLRGRVFFSPAFSDNAILSEPATLILSSPKASYYPIYIEQDAGVNGRTNQYQTYNDGRLAGWKRYPIRQREWNSNTNNADQDTTIYPVIAHSRFSSKIIFHNLKEIELGGLLSALTFHKSNNCYHQIGQGKPFGYGKVSIKVSLEESLEKRAEEFMARFEEAISKKIGNWCTSPSIVQLFTMSHDAILERENCLFEYMYMDTNINTNEFVLAKNHKEYLQRYTKIKNSSFIPMSLYAQHGKQIADNIERIQEQKAKEKTEALIKLLEQQQQQEQKELLERRQQQIMSGLSFLEEKYDGKNEYKVKDFKGAKNRIENWLKKSKNQIIPDNDIFILENTLLRLYLSLNHKEKNNWKNFEHDEVWTLITRWIGRDKAQACYCKIIEEKNRNCNK